MALYLSFYGCNGFHFAIRGVIPPPPLEIVDSLPLPPGECSLREMTTFKFLLVVSLVGASIQAFFWRLIRNKKLRANTYSNC